MSVFKVYCIIAGVLTLFWLSVILSIFFFVVGCQS